MAKIWKKKLAIQSDKKLKIKSFHLEMMALKAIKKPFSGFRDGIIQLFSNLENLILNELEDPIGLSGDISSYLDDSEKKAIYEKIKEINEQIPELIELQKNKPQEAIKGWNKIFGAPFPKPENIKNVKRNLEKNTKYPPKGDDGFGMHSDRWF